MLEARSDNADALSGHNPKGQKNQTQAATPKATITELPEIPRLPW